MKFSLAPLSPFLLHESNFFSLPSCRAAFGKLPPPKSLDNLRGEGERHRRGGNILSSSPPSFSPSSHLGKVARSLSSPLSLSLFRGGGGGGGGGGKKMGERIIRRSVDGDVGKGGERRRIDWPPPPPPPSFPHPPPCSTFVSNAFFVCLYRAEHGGGKSKDFVPVENIVEFFCQAQKTGPLSFRRAPRPPLWKVFGPSAFASCIKQSLSLKRRGRAKWRRGGGPSSSFPSLFSCHSRTTGGNASKARRPLPPPPPPPPPGQLRRRRRRRRREPRGDLQKHFPGTYGGANNIGHACDMPHLHPTVHRF